MLGNLSFHLFKVNLSLTSLPTLLIVCMTNKCSVIWIHCVISVCPLRLLHAESSIQVMWSVYFVWSHYFLWEYYMLSSIQVLWWLFILCPMSLLHAESSVTSFVTFMHFYWSLYVICLLFAICHQCDLLIWSTNYMWVTVHV